MKYYKILGLAGLAVVVALSALYGFREMLFDAVNHVRDDLTLELKVHAYILGAAMILYALLRHFLRRGMKEESYGKK